MKTEKQTTNKRIKQAILLVSALFFTNTVFAETASECMIYTTELCSVYSKDGIPVQENNVKTAYKKIWFTDGDVVANDSADKCMKRMNDYYNYCGGDGKNLSVYVVFRVHGINVISKVKNAAGVRQLQTKYTLSSNQ